MAALSSFLVAATVASGAYSAHQQHKAGKAAAAQGNYQGDVFDLNALDAERQAQDVLARGKQTESRFRTGTKQLIGSNRAALAAQGLDITSGSAADVLEEASYLGELDALQLRSNARREALGYETQAVNLRAQGRLARLGGKNQQGAANSAAVGTLLTTGAQAGSMYRSYRRGG